MEELAQFRPLQFGEILGTGWRLTRRTAPTAGVLVLITLIPLGIITGAIIHGVLRGVGDIINDPAMHVRNPDSQIVMRHLMPMFLSFLFIIPLGIVAAMLGMLGQTAITIASWEEINGRTIGFGEMLRRSFKRPYWYGLAQIAIMYGIQIGANFVMTIAALILGFVTFGIGAIVIYVAYLLGIIYFYLATAFRMHTIVAEECDPWKGLVSSYNLVKNNWWHTFAPMLLLMAVYYLLLIPILLPGILPFIRFIAAMSQYPRGTPPDPADVAALMTSLGNVFSPWTLGALAIVGAIVMLLIVNTLTALYVDLRARRGDFTQGDDEEAARLAMPS
jgi:hypothetical protein